MQNYLSFDKGGICSLFHDKGKRASLGRLIRIFSFYNKDFLLDSNSHDGIVSVCIDIDGVKGDDNIIIEHIGNNFRRIKQYLEENKVIQIFSFTIDAEGGGGAKESCTTEFNSKLEDLLFQIWYVITCILHGYSKPLELS